MQEVAGLENFYTSVEKKTSKFSCELKSDVAVSCTSDFDQKNKICGYFGCINNK